MAEARPARHLVDAGAVRRAQDELVRALVVEVDEAGVGFECLGDRACDERQHLLEVERGVDGRDRLGLLWKEPCRGKCERKARIGRDHKRQGQRADLREIFGRMQNMEAVTKAGEWLRRARYNQVRARARSRNSDEKATHIAQKLDFGRQLITAHRVADRWIRFMATGGVAALTY